MKPCVFLLSVLLGIVQALFAQMASSNACRQSLAIDVEESSAERDQAKLQSLANELKQSDNPHLSKHAYVLAGSVWAPNEIYVCWENPTPEFAGQRNTVQNAIKTTWQREANLQFTGWQKCATKNEGIRILIDDSSPKNGPHTKGLGCRLNGVKDGMVLNFTFNNWSPDCRSQTDYCIKAIAVHEFGHALGFAHEQNRPDTPGECRKPAQGQNGDILLTPYDPESVMNYCNTKYNNNGKLSARDVTALHKLYGNPLTVPSSN